MSNTELRKQIQEDFFILDGATGSNLQKAGMKSGECPEQWILNHPDIFIDLQKKYIGAGSDAVYAPTFKMCIRDRIKREKRLWGSRWGFM